MLGSVVRSRRRETAHVTARDNDVIVGRTSFVKQVLLRARIRRLRENVNRLISLKLQLH